MTEYTYDDRDRPFYDRAYTILVERAGAIEDNRESFILAFTQRENRATEYRCCFAFGFGGKFWRNNGRFYVSCYPESRTPDLDAQILQVNQLLEALVSELKPTS